MRGNGPRCKRGALGPVGFDSLTLHQATRPKKEEEDDLDQTLRLRHREVVAQQAELPTFNRRVEGSTPSGLTSGA